MNFLCQDNLFMTCSIIKKAGVVKAVCTKNIKDTVFYDVLIALQFELFLIEDERSAAYFACGMGEEGKEPILLCGTEDAYSRNFMPGLTEAYYRQIPLLVVTLADKYDRGHGNRVCVDNSNSFNDVVSRVCQIPAVVDEASFCHIRNLVYLSVDELCRGSIGPIWLDVAVNDRNTPGPKFNEKLTVPPLRILYNVSELPRIAEDDTVAVCLGRGISSTMNEKVACFCKRLHADLYVDRISNYHGAWVPVTFLDDAKVDKKFDYIIKIGDCSSIELNIEAKECWFMNAQPDTHCSSFNSCILVNSSIDDFLEIYANCKMEHDVVGEGKESRKSILDYFPEGSVVQISNNKFVLDYIGENHNTGILLVSNNGTKGEDGEISSCIGMSLIDDNKQFYVISALPGVLYNLNSFGNREIKENFHCVILGRSKSDDEYKFMEGYFTNLGFSYSVVKESAYETSLKEELSKRKSVIFIPCVEE